MFKCLRKILIVLAIALVIGALVFGKDLVSYIKSSARMARESVTKNISVEFELQRAQDLLEEIIPEMHANIRLIAAEEVEIAALKSDISRSEDSIKDQQNKIEKLSAALNVHHASYNFGDRNYTRQQVKADLASRFERFKEAELVLASKYKLLGSREKSLTAAMQLLDKTQAQKRLLADKISGLESQYRLVKAASVNSKFKVDNSKLAQTEKLINKIKKRLDVAERVLAHESAFVESIPIDTVTEKDLLAQIDEHFYGKTESIEVELAATPAMQN